jgi:hypothetical protein
MREWHLNGFLSRDSQMGVSKSPRLGVLQLCETITSYANLLLGQGLNRSCSPHQEISNGVLHITFTQRNRVDSWLSVVGSQTANLTTGLSFGHNLCCRCLNESCKPILDIYVSIAFQWYKEFLKARGFTLCNRSLKFRESTRTLNLNMGVHSFGSVNVYSHTLPHSRASLLARYLANLCLGCEPKARVATFVGENKEKLVETWHSPKLLDGFNCKSKDEDNGRKRSWGVFPNS